MELSLQGSQINLATRCKTPQPTVQYPTRVSPSLAEHNLSNSTRFPGPRRRPESASLFGRITEHRTGSSGLRLHNRDGASDGSHHKQMRRPASADHHQIYSFASLRKTETNEYRKDEEDSCQNNSSSKILNDLLAEPITKTSTSWRLDNRRRESEQSLGQLIKTKAGANMAMKGKDFYGMADDQEESSEEDFQNQPSGDEEDAEDWSKNTSKFSKHNVSSDNTKKYVTFSKRNIVLPQPIPSSTLSAKPDLPGRVSFSKSSTYEMDLSDDNEVVTSPTPYLARNALPANNETDHQSSSTETKNPVDSESNIASAVQKPEDPASCCSLKCNNILESAKVMQNVSNTTFEHYSRLSATQQDESDKIIDDYRREIEKINHQHDQELADIQQNQIEKTPKNPLDNAITQNYTKPQNTQKEIAEVVSNDLKKNQSRDNEHKSYTKQSIFEAPKTDNVESKRPKEEPNDDSTSVVIDKYLTTTNQKQLPSTKPSSDPLSKSASPIKNRQGSRSAPVKQTNTKPTSKRCVSSAKPSATTEDKRISEFQMEKVESWMSIHEFSHSTEKKEETSFEQPIGKTSYNQSWRDTPTSKTDDEGMFSYDDQLDDDESTYDDLVSVIKEIEEQRNCDLDAIAIGDKFNSSKPSCHEGETADENDKMKEILCYLDKVETSCEEAIQDSYSGKVPDSFRSEIEFTVEPDIIGDMPKMADLLLLPNQQLARRVIALSLRANELAEAMHLSREHVASVRTDKTKSVRAEKQTAAMRLADQKRHFESVVQRHQGFIEQLLKDKHQLGEKVAVLTRRIDSQNQAWQHKLETETARVKETSVAAEKIRRERWVRENTKKIKELTVKGLEHEINQMTAGHLREIAEIKRIHQQDLLVAVDEVRSNHEQLMSNTRESYAKDREALIEKERQAIRDRYERQLESEQKSSEEQQARLCAGFETEKLRWNTILQEKEAEFERRKTQLQEERNVEIFNLRQEHAERMKMVDVKTQNQLKSVQDQFEADFAIWRREHESAANLRQTLREDAIRQECRAERDRQIDAIVAKVDAESLEQQRSLDEKLCRMQNKFTTDLKELEHSERNFRDKYAEVRSQLAEAEANRENAQASAKQFELQLNYTQRLYDDLIGEKDHLKATARREIEQEMLTLRKDRDAEIERIYGRVQVAIEKKDRAIEVLHKDNDALKERCIKLEALVRQQRQDYIGK